MIGINRGLKIRSFIGKGLHTLVLFSIKLFFNYFIYFLSYSREIEGIHNLQDLTTICSHCRLRLIVDVAQKNVQYCQCPKSISAADKAQGEGSFRYFI